MFKELRTTEITQKDFEQRKQTADNILKDLKISKYSFFVTADQYRDSTY